MYCPKCNNKNTKVVETGSDGDYVYRQRKCHECGYIFYTEEYETLDQNETYDSLRATIRKRWNKHNKNRRDENGC